MKIVRFVGLMLLCNGTLALAQSGSAVLRGSVYDPVGSYIPSTSVSADCVRQGIDSSRRTITDSKGHYELTIVSDAPCAVQFSKPGFAPVDKTVNLAMDSSTNLDITLRIGATTGPVVVAQPPPATHTSQAVAESVLYSLSPVAQAANASWEHGIFFNGGVGLEDRTNFTFLSAGKQIGKMLTPEVGTGLLKGNLEYAIQIIPYWQSFTPKFPVLKCPTGATAASQCYGPVTAGGTYIGASIEPIIVRWNFTHGKRIMPWVQAAGGVLYTTRKYPAVGSTNYLDPTETGPHADTSVWNFTPQGGVGMHYFVKPLRSVDLSLNGVHISSASLGDKNPGVNVSLQCSIGYSWWK